MWHAWKYGDLTTRTMSGEDWRGWHLLLLEIWEEKEPLGSIPNRFFQNRNNHQLHQKRCWWQSATSSISFLPNANQCSDLRACMCGLGCRRMSTCIALQCGGVRECCWASAQSSRSQSSWSPSLLSRKQLHQWPSPRIGNVMSSLKSWALAALWCKYASRNETGNSSVPVAVVSWRRTKFKAALYYFSMLIISSDTHIYMGVSENVNIHKLVNLSGKLMINW